MSKEKPRKIINTDRAWGLCREIHHCMQAHEWFGIPIHFKALNCVPSGLGNTIHIPFKCTNNTPMKPFLCRRLEPSTSTNHMCTVHWALKLSKCVTFISAFYDFTLFILVFCMFKKYLIRFSISLFLLCDPNVACVI